MRKTYELCFMKKRLLVPASQDVKVRKHGTAVTIYILVQHVRILTMRTSQDLSVPKHITWR
jgi:hypothetical protein